MSVYGEMAASTGFGIASGAITGIINDRLAERAAKRNYKYNELSAANADLRTRALYNDLYSPQAQMQQIKEAGLSPSLYSGQLGGISGQAGAQGGGDAGMAAASGTYNIDPLTISQMKLNEAQAENLKADANKKEKEKEILEIKKDIMSIDFQKYSVDANMLLGYVTTESGRKSFAQVAEESTSYEQFIKSLKEKGASVESEQAQRTLREIYKASQTLRTEITTLSQSEVSADFQRSIINALKKQNYEDKNAEQIIKELNNSIATNTLSETQKSAWNKLIEELREKDSKWADIAIILGMIVDRFAGSINFSSGVDRRDVIIHGGAF